jgi:single-strand DNA-binding protein
MIEGRIEYGSYEKDGVKHYTTDIVAENMQMLGGPGPGNRPQEPEPGFGPPEGGAPEDDIPF